MRAAGGDGGVAAAVTQVGQADCLAAVTGEAAVNGPPPRFTTST